MNKLIWLIPLSGLLLIAFFVIDLSLILYSDIRLLPFVDPMIHGWFSVLSVVYGFFAIFLGMEYIGELELKEEHILKGDRK